MTRTQRQRMLAGSCAVVALLVLGVALVVWQAPEGADGARPSDEKAEVLQLLAGNTLADIAKDVDLDSLVAGWAKQGGTDLDVLRKTFKERFDAYARSQEFIQRRDKIEDSLRAALRDEKLRALLFNRLKDQPAKLQTTETRIVP